MRHCGFGSCGGHLVGGGGGPGWLAILDSIALWILAVAAILFLLGLRRRSRSWGRGGAMGRGRGFYQGPAGGPGPWGPPPAPGAPVAPGAPAGPVVSVPPHLAQAEANLAGRFSRGEISAQDYRAGIEVLSGQAPYPAPPAASGQAEPPYEAEPPQSPPADPLD
jgi:hypothetical protein